MGLPQGPVTVVDRVILDFKVKNLSALHQLGDLLSFATS